MLKQGEGNGRKLALWLLQHLKLRLADPYWDSIEI